MDISIQPNKHFEFCAPNLVNLSFFSFLNNLQIHFKLRQEYKNNHLYLLNSMIYNNGLGLKKLIARAIRTELAMLYLEINLLK